MRPPKWYISIPLKTLENLGLIKLWTDDNGTILEFSNMTLINLWLVRMGPMKEDKVTRGLVWLQVICGALGLFIRHKAALLVFPYDNLKMADFERLVAVV